MNTLFTFLLGAAGPLALRVLATLGVGVVTFTGVEAGLRGLITVAQNNWSSAGADVLGLAAMAGIPQALGIVAGAMVARLAAWVAVSATRWLVKG